MPVAGDKDTFFWLVIVAEQLLKLHLFLICLFIKKENREDSGGGGGNVSF